MVSETVDAVSSWNVDLPVGVADGLRGFVFGSVIVVILLVLKVANQRRHLSKSDPNARSYSALLFVALLLVVALLEQVERFGSGEVGVRFFATVLAMVCALIASRTELTLLWLERSERRAARRAETARAAAKRERERHEREQH